MKKLLLFIIIIISCTRAGAQVYEGLDLINSTNWAVYLDNLLGYQYPSRGDLHFYPADMTLLSKTIPSGAPLTIKKYVLDEGDPPFKLERIPLLSEMTNSENDLQKHAGIFHASKTELVVYPSLSALIIFVNGQPYARISVEAGHQFGSAVPLGVAKNVPIEWAEAPAGPTENGNFQVLTISPRFTDPENYLGTVIPFGAWLRKINGAWTYLENGWWYRVPDEIAKDIDLPLDQRQYNYLDEDPSRTALKWAGNDLGRSVLFWTADGTARQPQLGNSPGDLLYEQAVLVKDLVYLLTFDGPDDFDYAVAHSTELSSYREPAEADESDPRLQKALSEFTENRLPRDKLARARALGLYYYLIDNRRLVEKPGRWFQKLKASWPFLNELRTKLKDDFSRMGVNSLENRQNILEQWLDDRLEFKQASPPAEAKYVHELGFESFFKPRETRSIFDERERKVMGQVLHKILSGEAIGIELQSVKALNEYNFGRLLNDILGNLYRSHGCLHVSPRNSYFIYEILPIGAKMKVHSYSESISEEALAGVPWLADLVNYSDDLEKLRTDFQVTSEVSIDVYPSSGYWLLKLQDKPVARVAVKGGPRQAFNPMQGRDAKGHPIFENNLAYPTTPGNYRVFRKTTDYVSNLYYDTTIIPMGGLIRRGEQAWLFEKENGSWEAVPQAIADDLGRPEEAKDFTYYDRIRNASGEVVELKWGSHPFGKYAIETTVDGKHPFPELIHSSGDLIMEERQIINDLITLLSAPYDNLDDCVKFDDNFNFYKANNIFIGDNISGEALPLRWRAAYKLYYNLPMPTAEAATIPADAAIAVKIMRRGKPDQNEASQLIAAGLASRRKGRLEIDLKNIYGVYFDNYQYVVAIEKYANHYTTLKRSWGELSGLRRAMLVDFNNFVLKDQLLFNNFMRELMLSRTRLEKISQENAFRILNGLIGN